jgi:predicted MFS family arabinose efflux permease
MLGALAALDRNHRLLSLSFLLWGFGQAMFFYIQSLYITSLGATPEQVGYVLSISGLVVIVLYIPVGWWADRRGRKPVMLAGWALGAFAACALALAPDWRWVIPAQIAYLLSNFAMPAAHGYIAASSRAGRAGNAFAFILGSGAVGSIMAPAFGGLVADRLGFRAVYLCAAVMFALSSSLILLLDPQPVAPRHAAAHPYALLRNPAFVGQIVLTLLVFFVIELGQVMAPKFMQDVYGLSLTQIGWLGTIGALGVVTLTFLISRISSDGPRGLLVCLAFTCIGVALWLTAGNPALLALAYFVHGSDRAIRPSLLARISRTLDVSTMSIGYGFYETALRLGLAIAPSIAGTLYARQYTWPLYASMLGLLITATLALRLPAPLAVSQPALEQ